MTAAALGCQAAQAQAPAPAPTLERVATIPAGWIPLELEPVDGALVRGWGDPGRGCYAIASYAAVARQNPEDALVGFARVLGDDARLAEWTTTGVDGAGRLTRGALTGPVRARALAVGPGAAVVALTCVSNQRAPAVCAEACAPIIASFDPAKVTAEVAP